MRSLKIACAMLMLGGCGTYVPKHQILAPANDQEFVRSVAYAINCEMRNAIDVLFTQADRTPTRPFGRGNARTILENWGVQFAIDLTVKERSSISPNFRWFPTAEFTLSGGLSGSSTATRIDKITYFYLVQELVNQGPCDNKLDNVGSYRSQLIRSDLRLSEWLSMQANLIKTEEIPVELSSSSFTRTIKFEISASGNISPRWVLSESAINEGGSIIDSSRNKTHQLVLTMGPADKPQRQLSGTAFESFVATQIGAAVSRATDQ